MKKIKIILLAIVVLSVVGRADIQIVEPIYDPLNDPVITNFLMQVRVNDSNVTKVQAKIIGRTWIELDQVTAQIFQGTLNVSGLSNGTQQITARYLANGNYFYVGTTTTFNLQVPVIAPTPVPTPKPLYNHSFKVQGSYQMLLPARTTSIMVTNENDERVEMAQIVMYDSTNVKSGPFYTVNGRALISVADSGEGDYIIEVSKNDYKLFSDTFRVVVQKTPVPTPSPTPTPTPAPTPAPTPEIKYYPDANMKLTADEYRAWLAAQELKTREANLRNQTPPPIQTTPQPQPSPNYFYLFAFASLAAGGMIIVYAKHSRKESFQLLSEEIQPQQEIVKCPKCLWFIKLEGLTKETAEFLLKDHIRRVHGEKPEKTEKEATP